MDPRHNPSCGHFRPFEQTVFQSRFWRLSAGLFVLALLLAACTNGGTEGDTATSTTEDCVAAGTCSPGPDDEVIAADTTTTTSASLNMNPAEGTYNDYPVGFTAEGYPYLGDPDAPVSLVEFSDYLCPFCGRHFNETTPQLFEQYAGSGNVNFVFRDFPLAGLHPTAPNGHAASLCVAEQGAVYFWAYHDKLFAEQNQWANLTDNASYLADAAGQIGVDLTSYQECMDSGRTAVMVEQRVQEGLDFGYNGTPTFQVVNNATGDSYEIVGAQGFDVFVSYLDAVVVGDAPPGPEEPEPPELPFWANEGLAPDPARPGFNLAGDPYKGDPDAPLVVIEVGDFQCPACATHSLDVQPALDEQFVDTGRVLWVYKNLMLQIHPQSPASAVAGECAGDQGLFWEMHDLLYATQDQWAIDPPDGELIALAGEVGLDIDEFSTCLGARTTLERVLADGYDVRGIVDTTPTFIIIFDGQGAVLNGSRSVEDFAQILTGYLEQPES